MSMRRVLLAFATVFIGCGCMCGGFVCPNHNYKNNLEYVHAEREHRKKLTEPVIAALEKYKDMNGRYPDQLEALEIPLPDLTSTTDHLGKTGNVKEAKSLQYAVKGDGYEMRFSFTHIRPAWMGADVSHLLYISEDKKWYLGYADTGTRLPPVFPKRESPSPKAIDKTKEP
jgi:hypothetical protein